MENELQCLGDRKGHDGNLAKTSCPMHEIDNYNSAWGDSLSIIRNHVIVLCVLSTCNYHV